MVSPHGDTTLLVNGEWRTGDGIFEVKSPLRRQRRRRDRGADRRRRRGGDRRRRSRRFKETQHLPITPRAEALDHISARLARDASTRTPSSIAREGGKPLKWAKVEATRAVVDVPLGLRGAAGTATTS